MMSRGPFWGICPCGRIWTWLHFSAHPAFVSRMGKDKIGEWERDRKKEHVAVAAIGEVTKKRLQAYGIDVDVVPEQCDLEHLGRALEQFYQ
jgi:uroporphyrinogen-III synthase